MKISKWIKLIGIICILIGALPLIMEFYFTTQDGVKDILREQNNPAELIDYWYIIQPYFKKIVAFMYIIGGIFFLLKRSFSIKLMYIVILLSVIYNILPVLLLSQGSTILSTLFHPFVFPAIALNLLLLYIVFKMRKLYLKNPNKVFKPLGFTKKSQTSFLLLTVIGYALILVPVAFLSLLFYADFSTETHNEFVEVFNRLAPNIFESFGNEINLILCFLSLVIAVICQSAKSISLRIWSIILLVLSILLFILNLFQMM